MNACGQQHRSWTEFHLAAMLLVLAIPTVAALTPTPDAAAKAPVHGPFHPMAVAARAGATAVARQAAGGLTVLRPVQAPFPVMGPPAPARDQGEHQLLSGVLVADRLPATLWQVLARGV